MRPPRPRDADHHKAEFAARSEQKRHFPSRAAPHAEAASEGEQHERLDRNQADDEAEYQAWPGEDEPGIDPGADRDEIEPEQEPPERLDGELDLAAIFGLRQKQPGDERAKRHREVARRRGHPIAQDHQEARRHEELGALRGGDEMEERPQGEAPENDQRGQPQHRGPEGREQLPREALLAAGREGADHHQKRRDRQILKQEHRKTGAPRAGMQPLALDEHRNDDRGRGHRERRADRKRRMGRDAQSPGRASQNEHRHGDLAESEPEHEMAHALEPFERQLEPHREHERDDAEGADAVDRLDIDREPAEPRRPEADRAEPIGSERDAREQIAQHRAHAQPEEQRRDDARRHEEQQRLLVERKVGRLAHPGLRLRRRCASAMRRP